MRIALLTPLLLAAAVISMADDPGRLSEQEQATLDRVNRERAKENLPPLKPHSQLMESARSHSRNMAEQGKMSHFLGGDPFERIAASGYRFTTAAENVAASGTGNPAEIVERWMNSEIHRRNILNPHVNETGIGVEGKDGMTYFTQVFGSR